MPKPSQLLSALFLAVGLALGAAARAGDLPPEAVEAWASMASVTGMQARFVQTQHRAILSRPLESRGKLAFSRPDSLAWTVESPMASTFVMEGSRVGYAVPQLGVREEVHLDGKPEVRRMVTAMMVWMSHDLERVQADYDVTWKPGEPARAVLVPKDQGLRALLASIELVLGGSTVPVQEVILTEPDGDTIAVRLEEVELDPTFAPGTFELPEVR